MMFFKKKKEDKYDNDRELEIEFIARSELMFESSTPPQPAKNFIPDWYKSIPAHHSKLPTFVDTVGNNNSTVKQCMPFFDSWTTGYVMTTPCDVIVEKGFDASDVRVSSNKMFDIIGDRGGPGKHSMPIPEEYYQREFTWMTHWEAKTPKGYSCLYTHPINRIDLPFYTISGIMDTDGWWITGNHPFFVKKGFEGVIPMGTPMMTIFPFKRDNWKSSSRSITQMEHDVLQAKVRRHASSGYKKEIWSRKEYT
jgi:hypothetical protein